VEDSFFAPGGYIVEKNCGYGAGQLVADVCMGKARIDGPVGLVEIGEIFFEIDIFENVGPYRFSMLYNNT